MTVPQLKHVFDFTAWGPAEFPYIATEHSNVCVAHGMTTFNLCFGCSSKEISLCGLTDRAFS